jgi:hypothetical protein
MDSSGITDCVRPNPQLRARYIKTTGSVSERTFMLPDGSPPRVPEHEKDRAESRRPSRCHRRTSIEMQGSQSDHWNNVLGNQALQSLWIKHSDKQARDQQYGATIAALIGIGPTDEIEGMIAAQPIAAHNAAMECYRRAMIGEQTFEGHRENLTQKANRKTRPSWRR